MFLLDISYWLFNKNSTFARRDYDAHNTQSRFWGRDVFKLSLRIFHLVELIQSFRTHIMVHNSKLRLKSYGTHKLTDNLFTYIASHINGLSCSANSWWVTCNMAFYILGNLIFLGSSYAYCSFLCCTVLNNFSFFKCNNS